MICTNVTRVNQQVITSWQLNFATVVSRYSRWNFNSVHTNSRCPYRYQTGNFRKHVLFGKNLIHATSISSVQASIAKSISSIVTSIIKSTKAVFETREHWQTPRFLHQKQQQENQTELRVHGKNLVLNTVFTEKNRISRQGAWWLGALGGTQPVGVRPRPTHPCVVYNENQVKGCLYLKKQNEQEMVCLSPCDKKISLKFHHKGITYQPHGTNKIQASKYTDNKEGK
jgi:hypothetical protein